MINKIKFEAVRIVSIFLFLALCLASPLLLLFIGREEGGIIQITDHSKPKEEIDSPDSIFIDSDKTSSLNVDELTGIASKPKKGTVVGVSDTTKLSKNKVKIQGAGKLSQEGYYTSDYSFVKDSFVIAKTTPTGTLPEVFSLRTKLKNVVEHKQLSDYSRFTAEYTQVEVDRPAVELYMGYLLVDNGSTIDIYNSLGGYLMTFNDGEYIPAYERDALGNPLFYREVEVESGLLDGEDIVLTDENKEALDEKNKDKKKPNFERDPHGKDDSALAEGELKNEGKGNPVTEKVRQYYTLSYAGNYFVPAEFDDSTESRGVAFDYPEYYGLSDEIGMKLYAEKYDKYVKDLEGNITIEHKVKWNYKKYGEDLLEDMLESAYNFSQGLACVVTEEYYKDGGMYFINSLGNRAFNTLKQYHNKKSDRYIIENYLGPISNGPESIGYFYYDHGLVRARFETIDYWNYKENNVIQVYSSEEVLLNTRGERFPLPYGYEVKAYSDGMILLEKDSKYGFMDHTGAWIAEPAYSYAEAFSEGLAVLKTADGRFGMIDTEGNIILPFAYDYISSVSSGIIVAFSEDGGWEIFRKMTK